MVVQSSGRFGVAGATAFGGRVTPSGGKATSIWARRDEIDGVRVVLNAVSPGRGVWAYAPAIVMAVPGG